MRKLFFLVVSIFFLLNSNVKAASLCDYKEQAELNGKAANIKVSYELISETIHFDDGDAIQYLFEVSILNLTEEFYVIVTNNETKKESTYTYRDVKSGIVKFKWEDISKVTNFTIEVVSSNKTNCPDEKVKTLYLTIPRYNEFSRRVICSEYPDFYLCQEFVTFSNISEETFLKRLEEYKKDNNPIIDDNEVNDDKEPSKNIMDYIAQYKWIIIGSIAFVVVLFVTTNVVRNKKQRDFK